MLFSIRWCQILKQFDFVSAGCFQNSERNLGSRHPGDFSGEFTRLMDAVRKLEAKNIAPESERSLKIRNRNAGMIGGENSKRNASHPSL
jgi:hypothetical protein